MNPEIVIHQSGDRWVVSNGTLVLAKNETMGTVRWANNVHWIENDETILWESLSEIEGVLRWMTKPTETGR